MVKVFVLLLSVLFTVASVSGYLYLDKRIFAGTIEIDAGQKEFDAGQPALEKGKAQLEAGKLELAAGKAEYEKAHDNLFMVFADKLFNSGKGFEDGRKQIAEGDRQVAEGEAKIAAGEKRLDEGELELYRGRNQLETARFIRTACALGAIIFGVLSIALGIFWRKLLAKTIKQAVS